MAIRPYAAPCRWEVGPELGGSLARGELEAQTELPFAFLVLAARVEFGQINQIRTGEEPDQVTRSLDKLPEVLHLDEVVQMSQADPGERGNFILRKKLLR